MRSPAEVRALDEHRAGWDRLRGSEHKYDRRVAIAMAAMLPPPRVVRARPPVIRKAAKH